MSGDMTVHAGTCATCGQDLVQIREGNWPTRTYHPATGGPTDCNATVVLFGQAYPDTAHDQFQEVPA